ncbi:uncharacterized protein SPPG_07172 [Spizellomyces punctatus DAOM BR117]|uniref:RGS domain-containing protein n=1 Tax=Spizellomyces punctatus (strain DAOM BR117) TaxID=645134 RepID=A0A0L0H859_SPIPD|nr:uncharacterized protein SPPG_07172 [Spizellomyces punctatus DAOM BR117]KNC97710.1 hypothetical protein SPPG_07172 [Spizellomyces punctatus DAOM BR117]|eukprot:XP_016605750.1 hypothetical protein SPPG_07172 [Spizellomyces punctatus DAOM BR117]
MVLLPYANSTAFEETWPTCYKIVLSILTLFWAVTTGLFIIRRKSQFMAGREVGWTLVQAAAGWLAVATSCLTKIYFSQPCFIQLWAYNLTGMVWCLAMLVRGIKFYFQVQLNHVRLFGTGSLEKIPTSLSEEPSSTSTRVRTASLRDKPTIMRGLYLPSSIPPSPVSNSSDYGVIDPSIASVSRMGRRFEGSYNFEARDTLRGMRSNWWWTNRERSTDRYLLFWFGVIMGVDVVGMVLVQIFTKTFQIWPTVAISPGCVSQWEYLPQFLGTFLYYTIACPIVLWRLRSVRDNYGVRNDLLISVLTTLPLFTMFLAWRYIPRTAYLSWHPHNWYILGLMVAHTISVLYPVIQSYRDERIRAKMVLLHNMTSFAQVLSDKAIWDQFKTYMAADFCVENALFFEAYQELLVIAAAAFARANIVIPGMPHHGSALATSTIRSGKIFNDLLRRRASMSGGGYPQICSLTRNRAPSTTPSSRLSSTNSSSSPQIETTAPASKPCTSHENEQVGGPLPVFVDMPVPESARALYKAFYENYLEPGAPYEVNLPSNIRDQVQHALSEDKITVGMYDAAKDEVVQIMFLNSFPTFLHAIRNQGQYTVDIAGSVDIKDIHEPDIGVDSGMEKGTAQVSMGSGEP